MRGDRTGKATAGVIPGPGGAARGRRSSGAPEAAARALFAQVGRPKICALLRSEHPVDFRFVDDRTLLGWLAHAYRTGSCPLPADDPAPVLRSEWVAAGVRGLGRVMLSNARVKAGFTRVDYAALPNPQEVVDGLLARPDFQAVVAQFLGVDPDARSVPKGEDAALNAALAAALATGALSLFRPAFTSGEGEKRVGWDPTGPKPKPLAKPAQTVAHWIEIALVDEDGDPLAGERYELTLPSGEVRKGALDADGKARLDGLAEGGSAQVCFPAIDGREWRVV